MEQWKNKIHQGDSLKLFQEMPESSVDMIITSPPYWGLRDYGVDGQLGLEPKFDDYINNLCNIFEEAKRVLKDTGTCWVNLGDTYSAHKDCKSVPQTLAKGTNRELAHSIEKGKSNSRNSKLLKEQNMPNKSLVMIPFRFAIEMVNRGWVLRNTIIWHKPNCMPQSMKDRFTVDFEYLFFFSKSKKYYFETQYEQTTYPNEGKWSQGSNKNYKDNQNFPARKLHNFVTGEKRNKRCVWNIQTKPFKEAHFATYPEKLIETPIKAGCPKNGVVLDPFMGSGTTAVVAKKLERDFIGFELNPQYIDIANKRIAEVNETLGRYQK